MFGFQPGYPSDPVAVAPASSNTARTICDASSISEATELRWLVCTMIAFLPVSTIARLVDVSTRPGDVGAHLQHAVRQAGEREQDLLLQPAS